MGTSTISTGPFSIAMLNYQRVSHETRLFFDLWCLNIDIRLCWWNHMKSKGFQWWTPHSHQLVAKTTGISYHFGGESPTVCQHVAAMGENLKWGEANFHTIHLLWRAEKNWPCNLHTRLTKRISSSKRWRNWQKRRWKSVKTTLSQHVPTTYNINSLL